jgi:hypothetical protein
MGCGCGGTAAKDGQQFVVQFADGTQDPKPYASQTEAQVALARSGKTGVIKPK